MSEIYITCTRCGEYICIAGDEYSSLQYIMKMRIEYYVKNNEIPSHIRYSKMCRKCNKILYVDTL